MEYIQFVNCNKKKITQAANNKYYNKKIKTSPKNQLTKTKCKINLNKKKEMNPKYYLLHAYKIIFTNPIATTTMVFTARLPLHFRNIIQELS